MAQDLTDPSTLLSEAACLRCFTKAPIATLIELAEYIRILNFVDPMSDTNPSSLISEGACFNCYTQGNLSQTMRLVLLSKILKAVDPGADTSPQALISQAECFLCFGMSLSQAIELVLLQGIQQSGGTGFPFPLTGTPQVTDAIFSQFPFAFTSLTGFSSLVLTAKQAISVSAPTAAGLLSFSAPNLFSMGSGGLTIASNPTLVSVNFPALNAMTGGMTIGSGLPAMTSFLFPVLTTVSTIRVIGATALTLISFPMLSAVTSASAITLSNNTVLATLSLPSLITLAGTLGAQNQAALATVVLTAFLPTNAKDIRFDGCALTQASVDHVLARCVANPAYVSGVVNLTGGTNATPSAAGLLDKATLIGRGVTCTTN